MCEGCVGSESAGAPIPRQGGIPAPDIAHTLIAYLDTNTHQTSASQLMRDRQYIKNGGMAFKADMNKQELAAPDIMFYKRCLLTEVSGTVRS